MLIFNILVCAVSFGGVSYSYYISRSHGGDISKLISETTSIRKGLDLLAYRSSNSICSYKERLETEIILREDMEDTLRKLEARLAECEKGILRLLKSEPF